MRKPDWFQDWSDRPVVIVASGPSAFDVNLDVARGRVRVVALNSSYRLCPWADMVYGCDAKWWISENGLPDFHGLKVSGQPRPAEMYQDIRHVNVLATDDRFTMDPLGTVGSGGNSGFQALNLVAQFGARQIILVGYDIRIDLGLHWHGSHCVGLNNPNERLMFRWRRGLDHAASALAGLGVEVLNASPVSALTAYEKIHFEEAVQRWCGTPASVQ